MTPPGSINFMQPLSGPPIVLSSALSFLSSKTLHVRRHAYLHEGLPLGLPADLAALLGCINGALRAHQLLAIRRIRRFPSILPRIQHASGICSVANTSGLNTYFLGQSLQLGECYQ